MKRVCGISEIGSAAMRRERGSRRMNYTDNEGIAFAIRDTGTCTDIVVCVQI